jgi:hypothetical protein
MKIITLLFLSSFILFSHGFDFYSLRKIQRLHYNEPLIFKKNRSDEDIIQLAKQYDVKVDRKKIMNIKYEIYEKYMKNKSIYYIDIDNTICYTRGSDYINSIPDYDKIRKFNSLVKQGHEVHYWTARGAVSNTDWSDLTLRQLKLWNVQYSTLNMGKPHYNLWIDDKCINIEDYE